MRLKTGESSNETLIRSAWYWSKQKRTAKLKNVRLYPARLVIVSWIPFQRLEEQYPTSEMERAELAPRHKRRDMILVIHLKSGKKLLSTVPHPIYWRDAINRLLGISLLDWKEDQKPVDPVKTASGIASRGDKETLGGSD